MPQCTSGQPDKLHCSPVQAWTVRHTLRQPNVFQSRPTYRTSKRTSGEPNTRTANVRHDSPAHYAPGKSNVSQESVSLCSPYSRATLWTSEHPHIRQGTVYVITVRYKTEKTNANVSADYVYQNSSQGIVDLQQNSKPSPTH